jgi:hypothetical protein
MWQVKKRKPNTRTGFNGRKEALKYARPLTPVMYLRRWEKQGDKIDADRWYTRIYSKHSISRPIG